MYGSYGHSWMFGGGPLAEVVGLILVWAVLLLAVAALVRYLFSKRPDSGPQQSSKQFPSALDILKTAYARGDISREEYFRKREDLLEK